MCFVVQSNRSLEILAIWALSLVLVTATLGAFGGTGSSTAFADEPRGFCQKFELRQDLIAHQRMTWANWITLLKAYRLHSASKPTLGSSPIPTQASKNSASLSDPSAVNTPSARELSDSEAAAWLSVIYSDLAQEQFKGEKLSGLSGSAHSTQPTKSSSHLQNSTASGSGVVTDDLLPNKPRLAGFNIWDSDKSQEIRLTFEGLGPKVIQVKGSRFATALSSHTYAGEISVSDAFNIGGKFSLPDRTTPGLAGLYQYIDIRFARGEFSGGNASITGIVRPNLQLTFPNAWTLHRTGKLEFREMSVGAQGAIKIQIGKDQPGRNPFQWTLYAGPDVVNSSVKPAAGMNLGLDY